MNKSKSQQKHFKRRLIERYGIEINNHIYNQLTKQVKNCIDFHKITNRLSKTKLNINGEDITVVYDKIRKTLVTCYKKGE